MKSDVADFMIEVAVDVHPVAHEALSAFFFDLGCHGVVSQSFHDRVFRAYLPRNLDSKQARSKISGFVKGLEKIFPEIGSPEVSFGMIENRDWGLLWRKHYRPLQISQRLTVLPAWEALPANHEGVFLRIDPGPAFGTGEHATTRMCLRAIEECAPCGAWSMLDVGTGSGILAMYGAMLGALKVIALDNDPEALRWAERNIALNDLAKAIQLSSMAFKDLKERFTLVAANLILGTILEIMPHFSATVAPGGRLILSGLLEEQSEVVEPALARAGFHDVRISQEEEWVCMTGRKRGIIPTFQDCFCPRSDPPIHTGGSPPG
jgi:ribosomal protein L11 methyltransferase